MIESYQNGTTLTKKQANARAAEIAQEYHGSMDKKVWNAAGNPTNMGDFIDIDNIVALYGILADNGPVYARYYNAGAATGHLVVVTGVNLYSGVVYTNNPWGVRGKPNKREGSTMGGCYENLTAVKKNIRADKNRYYRACGS